jgi:hypothetical protein
MSLGINGKDQGFFSISWGRWTNDHPQEDLETFDHRSKNGIMFLKLQAMYYCSDLHESII